MVFPPISQLLAKSLRKKEKGSFTTAAALELSFCEEGDLRCVLYFSSDMQSEFKIINITARVNVYCHKISQVEDKASRDGIRKREDDDDGGEDEVGEENQTLADFPKSLRFLIGGRGSLGQMVDRDEEEEHDKWENQAKDQPHIDQLYVGGRGDLVGDRLVESVDDEHHGDADGGRGLEVLGPEVETTLADEHKAEGGKVGGQKVVLHAAFENQRHLNPRLSLCHLPVEQGKLCGKNIKCKKESLKRTCIISTGPSWRRSRG